MAIDWTNEHLNYITLSEREQMIVTARYGLDGRPPRTLREISQEYHITRERVRQIIKRAEKWLLAKSTEPPPPPPLTPCPRCAMLAPGLRQFAEICKIMVISLEAYLSPEMENDGHTDIRGRSIRDLVLSGRPSRILDRLHIETIGQLCALSARDLMAARGFGETSLNEVLGKLATYGLTLRKASDA